MCKENLFHQNLTWMCWIWIYGQISIIPSWEFHETMRMKLPLSSNTTLAHSSSLNILALFVSKRDFGDYHLFIRVSHRQSFSWHIVWCWNTKSLFTQKKSQPNPGATPQSPFSLSLNVPDKTWKQSLKFSGRLSTVHKHPLLPLHRLRKKTKKTGSKNKRHVKLHPVSVSSSPPACQRCDTEETARFHFTEPLMAAVSSSDASTGLVGQEAHFIHFSVKTSSACVQIAPGSQPRGSEGGGLV